MDLEGFGLGLGYRFNDPGLLRRALTHRSHGASHNERLEFLGDSVVNCIVALELVARCRRLCDCELARVGAVVVNQPNFIIAGSLEAVIGAVFLDGGFEPARQVARNLLGGLLDAADPASLGKDPKSQLQEFLMARKLALPRYAVIATRGVAHEQQFQVECAIPELGIKSTGEGASRRSAEQEAARQAYELATRT